MILDVILSANGKESLNTHYFFTNHTCVYAAAERIFGSWGNVITACGLACKAIRKYRAWNLMRISSVRKWYHTLQQHLYSTVFDRLQVFTNREKRI